ncbi:hypothetical protein JCM3765_005242 [Sporobolomyces pararoseus]
MEFTIEGGLPLKHFTRALTCLTKFGEELDFLANSEKVSISSVNSSRTGFSVIHFFENFFINYKLLPQTQGGGRKRGNGTNNKFKFSVNGKSLLSPLKPKSVSTIESCLIQIGGTETDGIGVGTTGGGECRIIIRLNCQLGVIKTHRLNYSNPNLNNWAKFDISNCFSSWKVSSKILKDWMDHFHLKTTSSGGGGGGSSTSLTDEITFYCKEDSCLLKSFIDENSERAMSENELMNTRPLTTELSLDVQDFDFYDITLPPPSTSSTSSGSNDDSIVYTFALKEFKAIIALADVLGSPITSYFIQGGKPLMIEIPSEGSDHLECKFVIATSNFDSSGTTTTTGNRVGSGSRGSVKPDIKISGKSQSLVQDQHQQQPQNQSQSQNQSQAARINGLNNGTGGGGGRISGGRLFNTPTPSPAPPRQQQQQEEEEEEEGDEFEDDDWGGFEDAAAAFEEIDQLSQAASQRLSQKQPQPQQQQSREELQGGASGGSGSASLGFSKSGAKILVRDTSEIVPSTTTNNNIDTTTVRRGGRRLYEEEEEFGKSPEPFVSGVAGTEETVLGPTQVVIDRDEPEQGRPRKKSKWNILDDPE